MIFGTRPPSVVDGFITVGIFLMRFVATFIVSTMCAIGAIFVGLIVLIKTMPTLLAWFGPVVNEFANHSYWIVPVIAFIYAFNFFWKKSTEILKYVESKQKKKSS